METLNEELEKESVAALWNYEEWAGTEGKRALMPSDALHPGSFKPNETEWTSLISGVAYYKTLFPPLHHSKGSSLHICSPTRAQSCLTGESRDQSWHSEERKWSLAAGSRLGTWPRSWQHAWGHVDLQQGIVSNSLLLMKYYSLQIIYLKHINKLE